jgi:asparagine N-glycosylation enzyme membrane subunit Stt3
MSLTSRTVTVPISLSGFLWVIGVALTIGDWTGLLSDGAGLVGVVSVAAGHLMCVHALFDRHGEREEEAFELGRESMRLVQ